MSDQLSDRALDAAAEGIAAHLCAQPGVRAAIDAALLAVPGVLGISVDEAPFPRPKMTISLAGDTATGPAVAEAIDRWMPPADIVARGVEVTIVEGDGGARTILFTYVGKVRVKGERPGL